MGGENGVVGFDDRVGHLGGRVNAELKLGLFAVVGGETLQKESTETRASSTAEGVEDEEALETTTVVGQTADLVHHNIDLLLSNGIMTTSI